jgi:SAM-dependent methyltransferase
VIARRAFPDYEQYVYLQGGKARARAEFLLAHLPKNIQRFQKIFRLAKGHLASGSVLCLGARTGAESLGAIEAGFAGSVGIDLHPVGPTVLRGDWHDLPFPDASFFNAYTNSLDHCLYLSKFASEVRRVLGHDGRFYLMATNRGTTAEAWRAEPTNEGLYWDTSDDLRDALCAHGFIVTAEWRDGKWGHYVFGIGR